MGVLQRTVGMRRMTGPAPESPMERAHLREPQQECNLTDGQTAFDQEAHRKFVTNLGEENQLLRVASKIRTEGR
jgi:hypothetical protein